MKISRKGFSTVEITSVIIIILMVLIAFGGYIKRGLSGRWKATGDTFGQGRQYDPRGFGASGERGGTLDCFYDQSAGHWVDDDCYRKNNCDCTLLREDGVPLPEYAARCIACKVGCQNDALCH